MSVRLAPRAVVGNLRFTDGGVYAEYLVSGLPFVFTGTERQDQVADAHAELFRTLPSGAMLSGLTTPVATRSITRRMLYAHPDLTPDDVADQYIPAAVEPWIQHCRQWEPTVERAGARRRVHWLSLPLDYGPEGRTVTGTWRRRGDVVVGRDPDTADSVARYRVVADRMVRNLPPGLFVKPAGVEQIWWHWNHTASRGAWPHPLPGTPYDPDARLPESAFTPVWFDPGAAALRGRRWRATRAGEEAFLRTHREPADDLPDAYQAFAALERFPDSGIAWPEATLFKVLDDLSTAGVTLDWTMHLTFDTAEAAVATAHHVIVNIKDQARQRGRHAMSDDELVRKLASGRELASELKRGAAERGVNPAIVIAAAGRHPEQVDTVLAEVIRRFRGQDVGVGRHRGSQAALWRAFNPGTETAAALSEFRNPTTTTRFAKFVPLLAVRVGNNTGVPLGVIVTSPGLRDVALLDLLNAPARDNPANLVIGGSPGVGKSHVTKNLQRSWLAAGARIHVIDPTEAREHARALDGVPDTTVIDPRRPAFTLDALRIFPAEEAAERTVDHLLPQLGFGPLSPHAARLKGHLAPASVHANGIGSMSRLVEHLRGLRKGRLGVDDDLLVGLEGLRAERLLRPLFDESLPLPNLSARCVVWNFGGLTLPTVTEEYQAHLHGLTTPSQRAAQALYGLAADLAQSLFFSRPDQPDVLIVEECAAWTHSPGGRKCANTIIRQGRKAWTAFVGVSQNPPADFGVLEDEFVDQRLCMGFKQASIAEATLRWCGRDVDRHPRLLADYLSNTSPRQLMDHGDDAVDPRHGRVVPGREGEAWFLDEFGGFGKLRLFAAPTAELAAKFDTNPHRARPTRRPAPR